jgi:hypothetical protein
MAEGLGWVVAIVVIDMEVSWFLSHVIEQDFYLSTWVST